MRDRDSEPHRTIFTPHFSTTSLLHLCHTAQHRAFFLHSNHLHLVCLHRNWGKPAGFPRPLPAAFITNAVAPPQPGGRADAISCGAIDSNTITCNRKSANEELALRSVHLFRLLIHFLPSARKLATCNLPRRSCFTPVHSPTAHGTTHSPVNGHLRLSLWRSQQTPPVHSTASDATHTHTHGF